MASKIRDGQVSGLSGGDIYHENLAYLVVLALQGRGIYQAGAIRAEFKFTQFAWIMG